MSYPFVLAVNGDAIARVNPDTTWSVCWDRVLDVAYERPQVRRIAVIAVAKLLLAAKDNFVLTPWAVSETYAKDWKHFQAVIDCLDHDPMEGELLSSISYNGDMIARVNYAGSWSVLWDEMVDLSRLPTSDYRAVALVAMCRLFMAAKDRFWTTPWDDGFDEDDE
jgi:spermidine/putrescine-binding protein